VPSPTTPVPAGYAVVSLADPNVVGATAVNFVTRNGNYQISGLGYVNYLNSNITLNTWIFGKWPTK
jgi:hypothetical protein